MENCIAERKLVAVLKGSSERVDLIIRIGAPYIVEKGTVNFEVDGNTAGCEVKFYGISGGYQEVVYGADLLQALQLASNVDPILTTLPQREARR